MTARRRRKEILRSFRSMDVYESADPHLRGDQGQTFVAVDLICRDCGIRLMRSKLSTWPGAEDAQPTWAKGRPNDVVDVSEVARLAVFVCTACSKRTGTIQRRVISEVELEQQLRRMASPGLRDVVERQI